MSINDLKEYVSRVAEGKIDFEGQRKVDYIARVSLISIAVVSFIIGFVLQSLQATFVTFGVSNAFLFLVVLPQWPAYNRHPVTFLPVKDAQEVKSQ